ncbi:beta-ketoacyl-[acyl-carrier-protein] synthase family protein [Bacteroides sp. 51]|uniref:beta-ketoacyl-[acyl-carrier-protein] synthase family protein n=1 Tax=Bacteroides sp. 51 TaxID=2302938 RepID=UPI0013D1C6EF|nr:beta-ketoacyl-[acyl-carrier-protein] synthase family protein [Bacteroides sp. 51]NDV81066.1 beta-ketoacyl-[acyl-carrier-protein] synthase family protein [Bacteroides sp. 51]
MSKPRIFVTGVGIISGIGLDAEENMTMLTEGKHGMANISLFPTALDVPVSEVKLTNEELKDITDTTGTLPRTALLGLHAAQEAMRDADLDGLYMDDIRIGFISATSTGGMDLSENFYTPFRENNLKGKLRNIGLHDCGGISDAIAEALYISECYRAIITTISTACSSAANAIMFGARLIRSGQLDAVVVGGTDALCRFTMNGFNSLQILSKEHCRPFDQNRTGLNLGEGAGYLVLQNEKDLMNDPYCELTGYANVNEAYHQTASSPEGNGPYRSMCEAIMMAGILPEEISYINAHGTGTPSNDLAESVALKRVFGDKIPPFSSVKASIGHTLGAAGGIEAALSALAIRHGVLYPNLNFRTPMEETGLKPIPVFLDDIEVNHVLSNSFGFGGSNTSLLFSKTDVTAPPIYDL